MFYCLGFNISFLLFLRFLIFVFYFLKVLFELIERKNKCFLRIVCVFMMFLFGKIDCIMVVV